jgi:hypothetical protein
VGGNCASSRACISLLSNNFSPPKVEYKES